MVWTNALSSRKNGRTISASQDQSWISTPVQCPCPFQCRCRSPSPHLISSVGSSICCKKGSSVTPAAICRPTSYIGFHEHESSLRKPVIRTAYSYQNMPDFRISSPFGLQGSALYRKSSPFRHTAEEKKMLEYANMNSLTRRLSALEVEMKSLFEGKSLKEKVQSLDEQDPLAVELHSSGEMSPSKNVCWLLDDKPNSRNAFKEEIDMSSCKKHVGNRQLQREKGMKPEKSDDKEGKEMNSRKDLESSNESHMEEEDTKRQQIEESRRVIQQWNEYNCELHLKRIIDSSRRSTAYGVLGYVHNRLTFHMLEYINGIAKGLIGHEKTHYLSFFKKEGPFKNKPLTEGTYAELLDFVLNKAKPSRDLIKALDAAEDGLFEDAVHEGYNVTEIGDTRSQMTGFLGVAKKHPINCSEDYYVTPRDRDMRRHLIEDLKQATDDGKLGVLQMAARLVKLGCFLYRKSLASEQQ